MKNYKKNFLKPNKLYIAYGSNLNIEQMKYRCPTAIPYKTGIVENMRLEFRKIPNGSGAYATLIPAMGESVPVLLWKISRLDEECLDIYEGFPTFYYKQNLKVLTNDKTQLNCMAYIMNKAAIPGIPSIQYLNTIYDGYMDNKLDASYLHAHIRQFI